MPLPTLDDLKRHLNKTTTTDDGELLDMLDAAVNVVEGIVGPVATASVTETHYGVRSDVLVLRRMPVATLSSVSTRVGATTTALTLGDYELDADTGVVRSVAGLGFYGSYTVTYTVGRPTVPAAIGLAVLVIAAHLWETQRVPGTRSGGPGFGQQPQEPIVPSGFAVPSRARELLEPYMLPAIA